MIHTFLIVGHAVCGTVALLIGCFVLKPPARASSKLFGLYLGALTGLIILMLAVVVYDWMELSTGQQVTFSLLCILGLYTGWRGYCAYGDLSHRTEDWQARYVDHVGFTVISLFDGFSVVAAIDLGAPLPVVIGVAVLGVVTGIITINAVKSRLKAAVVTT